MGAGIIRFVAHVGTFALVGLLAGCGADRDDSVLPIRQMSAAEFDDRTDTSPFHVAGPGHLDCGELPPSQDPVQPMAWDEVADPMECLRDAYRAGEPAVLLTRNYLGNGDGFAKFWLIDGPGRQRIVERFFQPPVGDWPPGIYWTWSRCTSLDLAGEWPAEPFLSEPDACEVVEWAEPIPLDYTTAEIAEWQYVYRCSTEAENRQEALRC